MTGIRASSRGVSPLYVGFAIVVLLVMLTAFFLAPGFFISALLIFAGVFLLLFGKGTHPYLTDSGVVAIVLGGVLAIFVQGSQLSLSLVHAL